MDRNKTLTTRHTIHYGDGRHLSRFNSESVHLVVTSPPYPMIAMWDDAFRAMNPVIGDLLSADDGLKAFELMHHELQKTWTEVYRLLVPGGIFCLNIGDATRTIAKQFRLYPNTAEAVTRITALGFNALPEIIWRKPSNSPTKFLGSGMLPGGAYVTLEHEKILIFRKPGTRDFCNENGTSNRRNSAYFWYERNDWFSDLWKLMGTRQALNEKEVRKRSGAFPFEIPFRLIHMYSSKLDVVLDPFLGTGTTTYAAMTSCRNSIGVEIDKGFADLHRKEIPSTVIALAREHVLRRLSGHVRSLEKRPSPKYKNMPHQFPVVTKQETDMTFEKLTGVRMTEDEESYEAEYEKFDFVKEGFHAD